VPCSAYTFRVDAVDNAAPPHYSLKSDKAVATIDLKLLNDMTIDETLYIKSGMVDLNGFNLTINGSVIQSGGTMWVNNGHLQINGDYLIKADGATNDGGNGKLKMINSNDYIKVQGNFVTTSSEDHTGLLTDGILEVCGDFIQNGNIKSFNATDAHKVYLNGIQQTIFFGSLGSSQFNILEINRPKEFYDFVQTLPPQYQSMGVSGIQENSLESVVKAYSENVSYWKSLVEGFMKDNANKEGGVNPATGGYSFKAISMIVKMAGFDLDISQTYDSQESRTGLLGRQWTFNYEGWIEVQDYGSSGKQYKVRVPGEGISIFKYHANIFTPINTRNKLVFSNDIYTLTTKDQKKFGYNSNYKLIWIEDKNGNKLDFAYDSNGRLKNIISLKGLKDSQQNPLEKLVTLNYNATTGKLDNISDPAGRKVTYVYEGDKLKQIWTPAGVKVIFGYDSKGLLQTVSDINGNVLEKVTYKVSDGIDKVDTYQNTYGNTDKYDYNTKNKTTQIYNIDSSLIYFNGHAYKVFYQNLQWRDAKAFCESLGGHLATVTSAVENEFILA
jgi:YD repeat-containing protein